jgi:hypothetical protein
VELAFAEIPESREILFDPPSIRTVWVAVGYFDSDDVTDLVFTHTPSSMTHPLGTLYRNYRAARVEELGYKLYRVTVPYGLEKMEVNTFRIETSDCTVRLEGKAGRHIATYPTALSDDNGNPIHTGLIGVKGNDVEGIVADMAATKISVFFNYAIGVLTQAKVKELKSYKMYIDTQGFLGWLPYESLFLGMDAKEGTDIVSRAVLHFAMRKNESDKTIGPIEHIFLRGWDIAWPYWRPVVAEGRPSMTIDHINVVRIPEEANFPLIFGFGGAA